ncbi:unnamed protein product [Heterobilharzia americana]|nr:unnamed protein product [Heterobilharzia americana]
MFTMYLQRYPKLSRASLNLLSRIFFENKQNLNGVHFYFMVRGYNELQTLQLIDFGTHFSTEIYS